MRRPFMLPASRASSLGANAAALFIARRGFFSATRIALFAYRTDEYYTSIDRDTLNKLRNDNREFEKSLCVARSVMVRMNVLLQEAQRTGQLEIPVKLSAAIAAEMKEQRKHRLEDHQAEIKEAEEELATISKRKYFVSKEYKAVFSEDDWKMRQIALSVCKPGDSEHSLNKRQAELDKLLHELKAVDTNSDAFLDRDATAHDCRKP